MDTSKTYIKMCDCEEIQKRWKPEEGDFISEQYKFGTIETVIKDDIEGVCIISINHVEDYILNRAIATWLPRQDQLQEMILIYRPVSTLQLTNWFGEFADTKDPEHPIGLASMEQLWLAFVMKEKHNKTWDGSGWKDV